MTTYRTAKTPLPKKRRWETLQRPSAKQRVIETLERHIRLHLLSQEWHMEQSVACRRLIEWPLDRQSPQQMDLWETMQSHELSAYFDRSMTLAYKTALEELTRLDECTSK